MTVVEDVPCKAAARPSQKAPEEPGRPSRPTEPRLPVSLISDWPIHFVPVPMATTSFTAKGRKAGHATGEEQDPSGLAPAPPSPACHSSPCRGPHRKAPRHLPLAPSAAPPPAQSIRACRGPASPASAAALHNGGSRGPPLGLRPTWPRAEGGRTGPEAAHPSLFRRKRKTE